MTSLSKETKVLRADGDAYLDPWMTPANAKVQEMVTEALVNLDAYENHNGVRKRNRKAADQAILEAAVTSLICAVTVHHLVGRDGGLKVTRSNRKLSRSDRYKTPLNTKKLPDFLDALSAPEIPWLEQKIGVQTQASNAPTTTIYPGSRLLKRIAELGVTRDDVENGSGGELIELRREKSKDLLGEGNLLDYEDTPQTIAWRAQLKAINEHLKTADVRLEGAIGADVWDRRLRRVFNNGRFDEGGRLYGGFWQPMSKQERFRHIRIEGERVVELDYGQVATRILYGRKGFEPPEGDLYEIEGKTYPREGMKKVLNALLYSSTPLGGWPDGARDPFVDSKTNEAPKFSEVKQDLLDKHHLIKDGFETGDGMRIMFTESEILLKVLDQLKSKNIVGLPIHDALLVGASTVDKAKSIMLSSFKEISGITGKVSIER